MLLFILANFRYRFKAIKNIIFVDLKSTTNANMSDNIPNISGYKYPINDLSKLKEILVKWNLVCMYQTCTGKKIVCVQIII